MSAGRPSGDSRLKVGMQDHLRPRMNSPDSLPDGFPRGAELPGFGIPKLSRVDFPAELGEVSPISPNWPLYLAETRDVPQAQLTHRPWLPQGVLEAPQPALRTSQPPDLEDVAGRTLAAPGWHCWIAETG